jgi:UDP-glucuronate decarboxylase
MKKILVTGGSGFIGSHLCTELLKNNNYVICIDNLSTGSKNNIAKCLKNNNFKFYEHDILNKINMDVDEIYHLACPASPVQYQINPINTFKTCIIGTMNIIELALKNKAPILHTSTSEIYGDPLTSSQNEKYWGNVNPIGIRACYNEGKRAAETLLFDYHRQHKLNIKVARIFNTYGPNMRPDDGRVISNFILQAMQNKPITIYGDGTQSRSFCYISDLIKALTDLMKIEPQFTGPINIGNPEPISIINLSKKILELIKSDSKIIFKKLPEDDPKKRMPDIELAKKILEWNPEIDLTKGLKNKKIHFSLN